MSFDGRSGSGGRRSRGSGADSGDGPPSGSRLAARYNAEGPEGRRNRPCGGGVCFLDKERLSVVRGWVEADPERDGAIRWLVRGIRRKTEEAFRVAYADESVRQLLPRGFAGGFRNSRGTRAGTQGGRVCARCWGQARFRSLWTWFQDDEARVGQKGMMSRL